MTELARRLRTPDDFARIAYGPAEITLACSFGAVDTLLLTGEAASTRIGKGQAQAAAENGARVFIFADTAGDGHQQLTLLGGAAALLRWSLDGCDEPAAESTPAIGTTARTGVDESRTRSANQPRLSATGIAAALIADTEAAGTTLSTEIADEFEVLEEIFPPGMVGAATEFCRLGEATPECLLVFTGGDGHAVCLRITLPTAYPDVHATADVVTSRRLTSIEQTQLLLLCSSVFADEAECNTPALFALATAVNEFLAGLTSSDVPSAATRIASAA